MTIFPLEFVKEIPGGGKVEKSPAGIIYVVTTGEQTPQHVSAWYNIVCEIYQTAPLSDTVFLLFDVSKHLINPNVRQHMIAMQTVAQSRGLSTRVVFLVQEESKKELQVFVNLTSHGNRRIKVVHDRQEAMAWLESCL
jgi:hypothetical protein